MGRLIEILRVDLSWKNRVDRRPTRVSWGWVRILMWVLRDPGFRAVFIYRLLREVHLRRLRPVDLFLRWLLFHSCRVEIGRDCQIGPGLRLPHPQGVVIGGAAEIGAMVTIGQHVTIGGNFGKQDTEGRLYPRIGRGCWIAAGAVVAGPVTVGDYAIVGANSVVTRSVPPYAVVSGIPARVLRERTKDEIWWDQQV